MRNRMQTQKNRNLPRWILLVAIAFSVLFLFQLYRLIVPFQPEDPLWHEVTIDEPVIDQWQYAGEDENGYLKFWNPEGIGHTVVLPSDAHLFSADGKFVVLESHTPSSLTYAEPYDAVPIGWLLVAGLVIAAAITGTFMWMKWKRQPTHRMKSHSSSVVRNPRFKTNQAPHFSLHGFRKPGFKPTKRWGKKK